MQQQKIIAIVGPTASGKSSLAVSLARQFKGELVSADSRQVYRGMDILTGVLNPPAGVMQHCVRIVNPDETYSTTRFQHDAAVEIAAIHSRKALPILVGGTAQYIDALLDNWTAPAVPPNDVVRRELQEIYARGGLQALISQLSEKDPAALTVVDRMNPRRIMRALEVVQALGNWSGVARKRNASHYDALRIGIAVDRSELRAKIAKRVSEMFVLGVVDEARKLLAHYPLTAPGLSSIGYDALAAFMNGTMNREQCEEKIVIKSYQYARRQMTWWKRDKRIRWIANETEAVGIVHNFLS